MLYVLFKNQKAGEGKSPSNPTPTSNTYIHTHIDTYIHYTYTNIETYIYT